MNCQQIHEYLDTTLPEDRHGAELDEVRRHARDCPGCARYLAETVVLEARLGGLPAIPAGSAVLPAVMDRVRRAPGTSRVPGDWAGEALRWVGLAAGVVLCVMAYEPQLAGGQWLSGVLSLHTHLAGLTGSVLRHSSFFAMHCAVGAVLAAVAILWQGSEEPRQPAAIG